MAQHSNSRDRGWRTNQRHSYPSQQGAYQEDFTSSAPARRHGRHDPMPPYERDNDHRISDANSWEPLNTPIHGNFPVDTGRPQRNELAGSQPAPGHFTFADRGPPSNWRQQEPNQMHFNDRGFMREDSRPIHTHGKNGRGPAVDVSQHWRGSQPEPQLDWRERDHSSDFDRGRAGRSMDWEPFQNQGWKEPHGNSSIPPFVQHHQPHQDSWTHSNEWQDGPAHWSNQHGRQPYDRHSFQQQNRRQHPYHRPHQSDNQNIPRPAQWDRPAPNHRIANHSTNADIKDQRTSDSPVKQSYQRKPEKRRHSRSRSIDSNRERRRSHSPKRRRRESPPTSRGVYNRRSRSRESRHSTEKHIERTSSKYRKDEDFNHRNGSYSRDKQINNKRDKYDEDEGDRHQKHDRAKPKKHENDRKHRSRSRSRSRSRTPRSRSRSASRSSSHSRVRRRRENGPARQRSISRSRSRSASPRTSMSNKMKASKHRLPAKSMPRMPLLEEVPLATSRAVLVTPARTEPPPVVPSDPNPPQKVVPPKVGWTGRGYALDPPRGPKYAALAMDMANSRADTAFKQFFPDAAPRPVHDPNAIPTLAPVEAPQNTASLLERMEDAKTKKPKAKMVPIGCTPTDSPISVQMNVVNVSKSRVKQGEMPQPTDPSTVKEMVASPATSMTLDPPLPVKDPQPKVEAISPKVESPTKDASMTPRASANTAAITTASSVPAQMPPRPRKPDELYKILTQVGEGTFGKVYKARNQVSGMHVALKRIRMEGEKDGFPVTAMREIKLLQSLKHENVVKLHEMMVSKGLVYMVFEYVHHDLVGVLQQTQFQLLAEHLKALSQQMLRGLAYLHLKGIIHRDLKASNILVNSEGQLKLADFGLARFYHKRHQADYTNRVITLWYRPPELLYGATVYGPEVDIWSAGCIFLELFVKKPTFQGNDEIHQLEVIFRILGTPTEERWPALSSLPWYEIVKPASAMDNVFQQSFRRWLSPDALEIAEKMLTFDPKQRITAKDALLESYFVSAEPSPLSPDLSTLEGEWHELEAKRMKKKRKAEAAESESTETTQLTRP